MTGISGEVVDGIVEVRVEIAAPAEVVFDYFVDADKLERWLGRADGLAPEPGGDFKVDLDGEAVAVGSYVEIDRPKRVSMTWGWEGSDEVPPGSSTVDITLEDQGDSTLVHVAHRDLPTDVNDGHLDGWVHYGARLIPAVTA